MNVGGPLVLLMSVNLAALANAWKENGAFALGKDAQKRMETFLTIAVWARAIPTTCTELSQIYR